MKYWMRQLRRHLENSVETVATFGRARLVRAADGRLELRGGSEEDRARAREWISLFMHEAVPKLMP
ncbi:MAG: hypothetical protein FJ404_13690 [Verrucomicrobia bacterium]|nr:hypothetical protein [Verrucomicrobiota bacterium]